MTKFMLIAVQLVFMIASTLAYGASFPTKPDPRLTPGSYCTRPTERRYRENIPYCKRNVDTREKWDVIRQYNALGYQIDSSNRSAFKIDHFIPLCAGGSNEMNNLWPQHKSVYDITDPVEGLACEKMAAGRLTQKRAVELIFKVKLNLDQADAIIGELERL